MNKTFFQLAKESFEPVTDIFKKNKKIIIPITAVAGVLVVSLIGFNIYKKATTSPVPELIQANFGTTASNLASAQKFYVSAMIRDGQDKYLQIEAEDRRDYDTDHIKAAYATSNTITKTHRSTEITEITTASQENISKPSSDNSETLTENTSESNIETGKEDMIESETTIDTDEIIEEPSSEEVEDEDENPSETITSLSENSTEDIHLSEVEDEILENDEIDIGKLEGNNNDWELYVTTIDLKYGVYQKIKNNPWTLTKKSKTISEDDARTNYVEKNNEVSFDIIDDNIITDVNYIYNKENKEYTVTGKTNYLIALAMMGNLRQVLYECPLYSYTDTFFNSYNSKIPVDVKMVFDKSTKQLKKIDMTVDNEKLQEYISEYNADKRAAYKIKMSDISFSIDNTSFAESDIYVPIEIERDAIEISK